MSELDWTRIPPDVLKGKTDGDGNYEPYLTTVGGVVKIRYASHSWWNDGVVNKPFMEGYWVREDDHNIHFYNNKQFQEAGYVPISHKLVKILFEELVEHPHPLPDNPEDSILFNKEGVKSEAENQT